MSKLMSELIKEWKEYSDKIKSKNKKSTNAILKQHEEMSELWRKEVGRINSEPAPKCLLTGRELPRMNLYPPVPTLSIPDFEKPTMEGFMDYLTDKNL